MLPGAEDVFAKYFVDIKGDERIANRE